MQKKKILLIGGNGFIGSKLALLLQSKEHQVSIVGRTSKKHALLPPEIQYLVGDFGDIDFISQLVESHDEVVHLAYASVPNTSFENPLLDLQENLTPSVQLFLVTAKLKKKLLLISSGGTIYGEASFTPISEVHPKHPISPYGLTKLTLENYAYLYGMTHGLDFKIIRPANAYGPGQIPFKGQGFIATAIASAKLGKTVNIFGVNGTVRDYIYIEDLAEALSMCLESGKTGESYNIGTSVGFNNLEVINKLNLLLKKYELPVVSVTHLPARPFDVKCNILDYAKFNQHTGWKPSVSLDQGLERTIQENQNLLFN